MPFSSEELQGFTAFAGELADAARHETLPRFRSGASIVNKLEEKPGDDFDPVTDADREGERAIRALIEKTYPDHGVLGEEFGERKGAGPWRWVLDPVDGTRAFMCGGATWTTLIALEYEGAHVLGLIDQPFTDERWIAFDGVTRYARGGKSETVRTSGLTDISKARISTTDPLATGYFTENEAAAYLRVAAASRAIRWMLTHTAFWRLASLISCWKRRCSAMTMLHLCR
jgi:myo-inositol-1(or 4)-monophosphatase